MAEGLHSCPNDPTDAVFDSLGPNSHKKKHRPALPYKDMPAFFTGLDDLPMEDGSRVAFRFMILAGASEIGIKAG